MCFAGLPSPWLRPKTRTVSVWRIAQTNLWTLNASVYTVQWEPQRRVDYLCTLHQLLSVTAKPIYNWWRYLMLDTARAIQTVECWAEFLLQRPPGLWSVDGLWVAPPFLLIDSIKPYHKRVHVGMVVHAALIIPGITFQCVTSTKWIAYPYIHGG